MVNMFVNLLCAAIWGFAFYKNYNNTKMKYNSPGWRIALMIMDGYLTLYFIANVLIGSAFSPLLAILAFLELIVLVV